MRWVLLALLLDAMPYPARAGVDASPAEALAALQRADQEMHAEAELPRQLRMRALYAAQVQPWLSPATLSQLDRSALSALFSAAWTLLFYSGSPTYADDLGRVVMYIERIEPLDPREASQYFQALVQVRRFEEAAAFVGRTGLKREEDLPIVRRRGATMPGTAYRVMAGKNVLEEIEPDLSGTRLIIVTHPLCAFSRRAQSSIDRMLADAPALAKRTVLLAPAGSQLHMQALQAWNRDHGPGEVLLARLPSDWPMLDDWATPNFYLLQDGVVIDHFSGWPPDGQVPRLRALQTRFAACLAGTCPTL